MVNKIDDIDFQHNQISNQFLRTVSSFRQLYNYPVFINFRKILFMIDGSLTFQFFSRHKLMIYEGNHDSEYFYIKDYIYNVNKYEFENNKYMNFFYRSPKFIQVIKLKEEANEMTFINFYNNFLMQRKKIN